ncbi:MAG TPA: DinB family protein, partial [Blastocatellia bacterium]|nr:DinB family protein [Blastocatellia bacterium]
ALSEALLPEFDHEMANTRKTLERVPEGKFAWKPHEKSFSMGHLASHLATLPSWSVMAVNQDSIDIAPVGQPPQKGPEAKTPQELLGMFDANVAAARAAIAGASDEQLFKPWTLLSGGKPVLTFPKIAVLRNFVMNHSIHHRAQLGVYLRLNDIPVPSIYGPSADEGSF